MGRSADDPGRMTDGWREMTRIEIGAMITNNPILFFFTV